MIRTHMSMWCGTFKDCMRLIPGWFARRVSPSFGWCCWSVVEPHSDIGRCQDSHSKDSKTVRRSKAERRAGVSFAGASWGTLATSASLERYCKRSCKSLQETLSASIASMWINLQNTLGPILSCINNDEVVKSCVNEMAMNVPQSAT
jgi:hypothetical protein